MGITCWERTQDIFSQKHKTKQNKTKQKTKNKKNSSCKWGRTKDPMLMTIQTVIDKTMAKPKSVVSNTWNLKRSNGLLNQWSLLDYYFPSLRWETRGGQFPKTVFIIIAYQSHNNKNDLGLHHGRSKCKLHEQLGNKSLGILIIKYWYGNKS